MNLFHRFIDNYHDKHEQDSSLPSAKTQLRLPLLLLRTPSAGDITRTETEEVNMEGFFCYAKEAFTLGEQLHFVLKLPSATCQTQAVDIVYLSGLVQVVLISACNAKGRIGIGCQVKHYRVMSTEDLGSQEEAVRNFLQFGI